MGQQNAGLCKFLFLNRCSLSLIVKGHLNAEYQSAAGLIKSQWKYEGNTWTWTFTIPEGATASVTLPGEPLTKEYPSGTYTVTKQGI
jgi:hypothetical protein